MRQWPFLSHTGGSTRCCPKQSRRSYAHMYVRTSQPGRLLCAGTFVYGDAGSNACPSGSSLIMDEATCRSAAISLGKVWVRSGATSSTTWPRGCYWWTTTIAVYVGTALPGAGNSEARLLCAVTTGAPTSHTRAYMRRMGHCQDCDLGMQEVVL